MAENLPAERADGIVRFAWEDLPALRALSETMGSSIGDGEYIAWQYERNPFATSDRKPLFLHVRDGRVEGQVGARLVRLKVGAWETPAHWITNLVVNPDLQKRGIGTALHRACVAETDLALAIDVTPAAERILLREGATDLGMVPLYARPLDPGALFARRRVPAGTAIARLASAVLGALDRRAARLLRADPISLVEVERFSAAADAIWKSCAPYYRVLVRRDRAYLNWRFADDPLRRYRLVEVHRGAHAMGIAVLRVGEWGGVPAGFIIDYLCAPRDAEVLFSACLDVFQKAGLAAAYCLHLNPVSTDMLLRLGFVRRPGGFRFLACGGAGGQRVRTRRNWFVTFGDSNVDRPRPPSGA